jgi:hypothetical protein
MAAELLSFFRPAKSVNGDWSTQEIAEFYRVEAALVQAGTRVCVERGVSDEGDPWFVFCRAMDGDVIVHFARIDGTYLIVAGVGRPLFGSDVRRLLGDFVERNPALIPMPMSRGARLMLHPASLLAAVVATALYHMSGTEAVATALNSAAVDDSNHTEQAGAEERHDLGRLSLDRQVAAVVAAMAVLTAMEFSQPTQGNFTDLASTILESTNDQHALPHPDAAEVLSVAGLDQQSLPGNQIDTQGLHTWLDGLFEYGGGQALLHQFPATANDNTLPKLPAPTTDALLQQPTSSHWWDSLSPNGDISLKYFAGADPSTGLAGGSAFGVASTAATSVAPVVALQLPNQQGLPGAGSSSPDQPMLQPSEVQAAALVNSELGVTNHVVSQYNIGGNLSLQGAINLAVVDVFGSAAPAILQTVTQHDPTITTQSIDAGTNPSQTPTVTSTSSIQPQPAAVLPIPVIETTYQAFDAAAGAIFNAFLQENRNNVDEVISNNHVLLFDTKTSDLSSPDFTVKTWSMPDGSTISIIGLLPHNLALQV